MTYQDPNPGRNKWTRSDDWGVVALVGGLLAVIVIVGFLLSSYRVDPTIADTAAPTTTGQAPAQR